MRRRLSGFGIERLKSDFVTKTIVFKLIAVRRRLRERIAGGRISDGAFVVDIGQYLAGNQRRPTGRFVAMSSYELTVDDVGHVSGHDGRHGTVSFLWARYLVTDPGNTFPVNIREWGTGDYHAAMRCPITNNNYWS
jgi:hypothetical protein